MVISSEFEPFTGEKKFKFNLKNLFSISGWVDNLNGPMSLFASVGFGFQHVTTIQADIKLDYVPVDLCVKGMIVSSWRVFKEKTQEIPIFNASSIKTPSLGMLQNSPEPVKYPPLMAFMYCSNTFTTCFYYAWIIRILENLIPSMILDRLLVLKGEKPK